VSVSQPNRCFSQLDQFVVDPSILPPLKPGSTGAITNLLHTVVSGEMLGWGCSGGHTRGMECPSLSLNVGMGGCAAIAATAALAAVAAEVRLRENPLSSAKTNVLNSRDA
jgi:hypothetical protein